jgi:subtilisin family serine protease
MIQKVKEFFKTPEVEYGHPPVISGSMTVKKTGFQWYESLIDYEKVKELIEGYIGRVAVLDDTAKHTNKHLQGVVETVYEFTGEKGVSGFHGHHVGGIIASQKHGLFKNIKVGMFKVLSADTGKGASHWIKYGIEAAQIEGYEVINASLGSAINDKSIENAIKVFIADPKRFFVAAAGNSNKPSDYPAAHSKSLQGVISVGALEEFRDEFRIATFSSYGAVTLVAPGVDILSTFPKDAEEYLSGTSMATPFVAGLIAASKAIYPAFTHLDFHNTLEKCVHKLPEQEVVKQGKGVVKFVDFLKEVHNLKNNITQSTAKVTPPVKKKWYEAYL